MGNEKKTDPDNKPDNDTGFTHDPTRSHVEVPNVTRLLNRKSLTPPPPLKASSQPSKLPPALPPAARAPVAPSPLSPEPKQEGDGISLDLDPSSSFQVESNTAGVESIPKDNSSDLGSISIESSPDTQRSFEIESSRSPPHFQPEPQHSPEATVKVKPAAKRVRTIQKLILWDINQLKQGSDPLGKGLAEALAQNGVGALFLAIQPLAPGSSVPTFASTAAVMGTQKLSLWTGLKWDPTIVPEMWHAFVKTGQYELAPPGSFTNIASSRNVVRAAFGILQTEWLLILRVGTQAQCRGVVALVTLKSILTQVTQAAALIATPVTTKIETK